MAEVWLSDEAERKLADIETQDMDCADVIDDILEDIAADPHHTAHVHMSGGGRITTRAVRGRDLEVAVAWTYQHGVVRVETVTTLPLPPRPR